MKAWMNHFALNVGAALSCVWHAVVPPQWTGHSPEDVSGLSRGTFLRHLWVGLGGSDERGGAA